MRPVGGCPPGSGAIETAGKGRPQLGNSRAVILGVATLALFGTFGCGKKPASADSKKPSTADNSIPRSEINLSAGHMDAFSSGTPRRIQFSVDWQHGNGAIASAGRIYGELFDVKGKIFKDGKPTIAFTSKRCTLDKQNQILTLHDGVDLVAIDYPGQPHLYCDTLTYAETNQIMKASGNVRIVGPDFSMENLPELWCANDFSQIATPNQFVVSPATHPSP